MIFGSAWEGLSLHKILYTIGINRKWNFESKWLTTPPAGVPAARVAEGETAVPHGATESCRV